MIDRTALRRIRTDRGLSQRKLAAAMGVDPLTVHSIEQGADAGDLPLRALERLVTALGVEPHEMLRREQEPVASDHALSTTVGATLHAHGRITISKLGAALAAPTADIQTAIDAVDAQLGPAGMSVARHGDEVWLVAAVPTANSVSADRPLTLAEARLLRRIHRGEDVRRALSGADRQVTLPALQRRALVEDNGAGPVLSVAAVTSVSTQ